MWLQLFVFVLSAILIIVQISLANNHFHFEQRNEVYKLRPFTKRYNTAFYHRHNNAYRFSSAVHFAHAKQHDVLQLTPLEKALYHDAGFDAEALARSYNPPRIEPTMMYYGPYVGQEMWKLYLAIDWTHIHHEQTYDILSYRKIPWSKKKEWTDKSVQYYLTKNKVARSPAPLDVTMRRAGVLMKPYFSYFRNNYPKSNNYFYVAHWWHPVIYEAMMIAGNDDEQEMSVQQTHQLTFTRVFHDRPQRMLLSREIMPRYSRMSPESGNIFDNLHMLHGIAYDILAYEGWTIDQKREEMYRVVMAMSYQPGDENLVRKFDLPHPDMDPRRYEDWMKGYEGSMNRMMEEMLQEMWPLMSPDGGDRIPDNVMEQFRMKLMPGVQEGEISGSLHDAIMKLVPDMKMDHKMMEPGVTPHKMIKAMIKGWHDKYGNIPDVEPIPMDKNPDLPPISETGSSQAS